MSASGRPPAGWYKDPSGIPGRARFYDGTGWTDQTRTIPTPDDRSTTGRPASRTAAPAGTGTNQQARTLVPAAPVAASAGTRQAALLTQPFEWTPKERATSADPGWYPDPGRSRKLRFYDGEGWTVRVRVPLETQMRSLPKVAVTARARLLEVADDRAARSEAGRRWRRTTIRVTEPQSLHRVVRGKSGRVGGTISIAMLIAAVAMAGFAGWQKFGADAFQHHAQEQLRTELQHEFDQRGGEYGETFVANDPAPVPVPTRHTPQHPPATGPDHRDITPWPPAGWQPPAGRHPRTLAGYAPSDPVGRLIIPKIGLDEVMVVGTGSNELAKGPGVAMYGMLPGSPGNAIIAGHRTGWGEPFNRLDELSYGDQIIVEVPGQSRSVYEVRGRSIVLPGNTAVVEQTPGVRLTLTTCHPESINTHRLVVQAEMIEGDWLDQALNRSQFHVID